MLLAHEIDASAIDSTVLKLELQERPSLAGQIRIIETFGPSPIPPWVVANSVAPDIREAVRATFLQMHETREGQRILSVGQIDRFVRVEDRDYDAIREMAQKARQVSW
jgi:phosphonate transport system substrate-binding protein